MPHAVVHHSWSTVPPALWDALHGGHYTLTHHWLSGLEETGCACPQTGWHPRPILVVDESNTPIAGAPAWIVEHGEGQFQFDTPWKHALEKAGKSLYPKVIVGVPYTPTVGPRMLLGPDPSASLPILIEALDSMSSPWSGSHILFNLPTENELLQSAGFFPRKQPQFHWKNRGYSSWQDFLSSLRRRVRKQIQRERRELKDLEYEVHHQPNVEVLDHLFNCYEKTVHQYTPQQTPPLTRSFYEHLSTSPSHIIGVVAKDQAAPIAGALLLRSDRGLYGRTWGTLVQRKFLHFEVCYYLGIEMAIEQGLEFFDPGHGGEYKFHRGFEPISTWSHHRFKLRGVHHPFQAYGKAEEEAVNRYIQDLEQHSPNKSTTA